MMGDASKRVYFGTFHAIFFTILKYAYHYTADNIIRDDTKRQILKELINKEDIEIQDENDFLNDIEGEISRVKGEMIELQTVRESLSEEYLQAIRKLYRAGNL